MLLIRKVRGDARCSGLHAEGCRGMLAMLKPNQPTLGLREQGGLRGSYTHVGCSGEGGRGGLLAKPWLCQALEIKAGKESSTFCQHAVPDANVCLAGPVSSAPSCQCPSLRCCSHQHLPALIPSCPCPNRDCGAATGSLARVRQRRQTALCLGKVARLEATLNRDLPRRVLPGQAVQIGSAVFCRRGTAFQRHGLRGGRG